MNDAAQSRESIEASIEFSGDDRLPETIDLEVSELSTRGLCWIDTTEGSCTALAEAEMPVSGPLYLLSRLTDLSQQLENELASKFERIPDTDGLSSEWQLWVIEHVDDLRPSERSAQRLIGDDSGAEERARISFYGGCVIQRAGGRMYLDYDLPHVEVQMPPNSVLECDGLTITELSPSRGSKLDKNMFPRSITRSHVRKAAISCSLSLALSKVVKNFTKRLKIASEAGARLGYIKIFQGIYGEPESDSTGIRGYTHFLQRMPFI